MVDTAGPWTTAPIDEADALSVTGHVSGGGLCATNGLSMSASVRWHRTLTRREEVIVRDDLPLELFASSSTTGLATSCSHPFREETAALSIIDFEPGYRLIGAGADE